MKTSDILQSFLILLIFLFLYFLNIFSIGTKNIKNKWPLYRCNPMVMPFANIFDEDIMKNFIYCIQGIQGNYMKYLMQPLNYNFTLLGKISDNLSSNINDIRKFINYLRTTITDAIKNIFGVFLNIIIEFQRVIINIKDLFSKLVGILATLIYTISGVIYTMESGWNGPPGKMVRALCFHPDTKILTKDNKLVSMREIEIGTILKNDARVSAVMKISNLDEKNNYVENMYKINNGENNEPIYVTGSHLIYDKNIKNFVEVKNLHGNNPSILTNMKCNELSCLITSNNTIAIGEWIFHDWEDKR